MPIFNALVPVLRRLTDGKNPEDPLLRGPRGGVMTTATARDATKWDHLVADLGLTGLTRHGPRHTGATWLADSGVPLHVLQQILGHQPIETTKASTSRPPPPRRRREASQSVPVSATRQKKGATPRRTHAVTRLGHSFRPLKGSRNTAMPRNWALVT